MRKLFSTLMLLILLLVSANVAFTVGKVTVDPNASTNKASDELEQKTDVRLAKKVTYEARRKMVSVILAELSEQTGVTLKAGYNNKDWQVRDRRMNIFAKDTPLSELMSSIARVMKFKWSKSDDTAPAYRLYMDRKTLLDAESQRLREEQQDEQRQIDKRRKMLESYAKLARMSPQDLAKLKEDSPFMYLAATNGIISPLATFFKETPIAIEALATGQPLSINAGTLSFAAQQGLVNAMNGFGNMISKVSGGKASMSVPDDISANMGHVTFQMNQSMEMMKSISANSMLLGMMSMKYNDKSFDIPILDPESSIVKLAGKIMIQSQEEQKPVEEMFKNAQGEIMTAMISDISKNDTGEPLIKHQDDPSLEKKVTLKPENRQLDSILDSLSESSEFAVVSDSFGKPSIPFGLENKEMEIKDILDKISSNLRYNWDKHSSVIEFRDREWFKKRAAQIPEEWLEHWRNTLKETGTLDLGDLCQIAMLTYEQLQMNVASEDVFRNTAMIMMSARGLLRFIAALNDNQRAMLLSASGLDLADISQDQYKLVEQLLNSKNPLFFQNPETRITIKGSKKKVEKEYIYSFEATSTDIAEPVKWYFGTPRYEEPAKPKEQPKQEETKQQTTK